MTMFHAFNYDKKKHVGRLLKICVKLQTQKRKYNDELAPIN